jgi:ribonucleoside-diphosphate reductase alpha chain
MGILRVDHPDILEFITCKEDNDQINNFNISVAITDEFMSKLADGEEYEVIDPHVQKPVQRLKAKDVFDLIVKQAHKNGEPGIIFIDRVNQYNPTPKLGKIESTNPCGEQPLLPYESCDLGSINLARMYKVSPQGRHEIDWDKLKETTRAAVHFLDNLIDVNKFPLPEIERATKATRKIGLGVMGWATFLIRLSIAYNSEEAVALAEKVMSFILERRPEIPGSERTGVFPSFKAASMTIRILAWSTHLTTIAPRGRSLSSPAPAPRGSSRFLRLCITVMSWTTINWSRWTPYSKRSPAAAGSIAAR